MTFSKKTFQSYSCERKPLAEKKKSDSIREILFQCTFFSSVFCLTNALGGSQTTIDLHVCDPDFLILNYVGFTLREQRLP